jgi:3-oxoadipate enol-lactonase
MLSRQASIDYDVQGEGPDLLLISGLGFGRWGWFKQVPELSRHFRTITFDVHKDLDPRHGVADLAEEAFALLDHLGVEKAHVLGTSLGGFVAQKLAITRPDLVDGLVLICTSYGSREPEPMSLRTMGRLVGWGSFGTRDATRRGLQAATSQSYRSAHPEEFEEILRWRLASSPSFTGYYEQALAGVRFDSSRDVRNISAPTLVIHGSDDRYVPVGNAAALAGAIPDSRLVVLRDAGHLVFIERAWEVNREITSFLERL